MNGGKSMKQVLKLPISAHLFSTVGLKSAPISANLRQKEICLCAPLWFAYRVAFAVSGPLGLRGSAVAGQLPIATSLETSHPEPD
jgi:hypothetical protein